MALLLPDFTWGGSNSVANWVVPTWECHVESVLNDMTKARKMRLGRLG